VRALAWGLSVFGLATGANAVEYESQFGFAISVPEVWMVFTRGEIVGNASRFLEEGRTERFEAIPQEMRQTLYDRISAGDLEIFYRGEGPPGSLVENVNVMIQTVTLPRTHEQLVGICRMLPTEFSRVFGRPIGMDSCEMRDRAERSVLYLQFDGPIPGTTTLQYQLPRDSDDTLVLTATAVNRNLPRMLSEFEEMVSSIRMH